MKRNSKLVCLTFAFLQLFTRPLFGQERFELFKGVRQMGMGGAAIAVVNDETALLSNPAALGKIRVPIFSVVNLEVHTNDQWSKLGTTDTTVLTDPQKLLDTLKQPDNRGKTVYAKGSFFPAFVTTNFGVGLYGSHQTSAKVDTTATTYRLDYINDYSLVMGFNFRFFDGKVKLGVAGRATNRIEIRKDIDANSTGLQFSQLVKEGQGIAADTGLILTGPWVYLPSISAVWRDVGDTEYRINNGYFYRPNQYPDSVKNTVDVGFSVSPILGKAFRLQVTAEYRDIRTSSEEADTMKRVHAGVELNVNDTLFLRAGMNQRYWTAGFEFSTSNFQFQGASYGEEIGTASSTKEDRRYVGQFALRF